MKKKTKNTLIVFSIVLVILVGAYFTFIQNLVFPNREISGFKFSITNQNGQTNFLEGDTIKILPGEPLGCGAEEYCAIGILGYMIFVNDKLMTISGKQGNAPHYSICGNAGTSQIYWDGDCGSWYYAYKDLLRCSKDGIENCNYPKIEKLEAGNNQEVEVLLTLQTSGGLSGQYNRFKINIASLPCVLDSGQSIVAQTFQSGSTINKNNLQFSNAFVKTCSSLLPIIVDSFTKTSYTDLSILTKLNNNFDYVVPSDRVIALFYVVDNNKANLPIVCDFNKAYNLNSGKCEDINAFITTCVEGNFDIINGIPTCVTQPFKGDPICPEGSHWDLVIQTCVGNEILCRNPDAVYDENLKSCTIPPNSQGLCPQEKFDKEKNVCILDTNFDYLCSIGEIQEINGTKTCLIKEIIRYECLKGFEFNAEEGKCIQKYSKVSNMVYWIVGVIIVLSLILYFIFKPKKRRR